MTKKKDPKDLLPPAGGRPSGYKEEYSELAYKYCLLGLTDKELAKLFDVTEKTINNWKIDFPEFLQSIRKGKEIADSEVADSMYQRACGYSHPEEKIFNHNGEIITHETIKHYPPDTQAASLWLRNRHPEKWRDNRDITLREGDGEQSTQDVLDAIKDAEERLQQLEDQL